MTDVAIPQSVLTQVRKALEAAENAATQEWLYQTGQFSRVANPPSNYPPQGSVCAELGDLVGIVQSALQALKESDEKVKGVE